MTTKSTHHPMKNIVVYCGSNFGNKKAYFDYANALGTAIAQRGSRLIYGGGNVGLMGTVADAVLASGGEVIGIIPKFLKAKEVAHLRLTELIETEDMASRKLAMIARGDAFIVLPGGIGTYEELLEVLSLAQLRQHAKPIGILNIDGYYDPLIKLFECTAEAGFMPMANLKLLCIDDTIDGLLEKMASYQFTDSQKWIKPDWMDATVDITIPKFTDDKV